MGCAKTKEKKAVAVQPPPVPNKEDSWSAMALKKKEVLSDAQVQQQKAYSPNKRVIGQSQVGVKSVAGTGATGTVNHSIANEDTSTVSLKLAPGKAHQELPQLFKPSNQQDDDDHFEEFLTSHFDLNETKKQKSNQLPQLQPQGKAPLPTLLLPPVRSFIHENPERMREHAAQILHNHNPEAAAGMQQMSKNTFQLPPLANAQNKQKRMMQEQQLTEDFYKHVVGGRVAVLLLPLESHQKKGNAQDELENLLSELRENSADSFVRSNEKEGKSSRMNMASPKLIAVPSHITHQDYDDRSTVRGMAGSHASTNLLPQRSSYLPPVPEYVNHGGGGNNQYGIDKNSSLHELIKDLEGGDSLNYGHSNTGVVVQGGRNSPYVEQFMNVHKNTGHKNHNPLAFSSNQAPSPIIQQVAVRQVSYGQPTKKKQRYGDDEDDDELLNMF